MGVQPGSALLVTIMSPAWTLPNCRGVLTTFTFDLCTVCAYNSLMSYQWDPAKARANLEKHNVDFADAVGVFEDEWALTIKEQLIAGEQRFATLGIDFLGRVLVVVYTYRGNDIRLISARRATKQERRTYERKRV